MINIKLNREYTKNDVWGKYLIYHLSNHHDVKTEILKDPLPILIGGRRGINNFTPFIYNDIVFIIDDWDHASPTCYLLNNPNIPKFYLDNNVCILKIQYCLSEVNNYNKIYKQTNIKILPFIMFANHTFELENFKYDINYNHKYNYIITGKPWRHRLSWIRQAQHMEYGPSNIDTTHTLGEHSNLIDNLNFYEILKESRWGLILKGKGCGGKNRREVEFSSLGMPLALNYIPSYPFDFVPNKDFILLERPEDLIKLNSIDPTLFAERSKQIYIQYFSPEFGIYNSFKKAYEEFKYYCILEDRASIINYTSIEDDPDLIEIIANKGHKLGLLNSGDYISLQYVKGAWKSWGKGRRNLVSPDNTNGRGGNMAKLGIFRCGSAGKTLLHIVPEHTSENPFIFHISENNTELLLDICDQGRPAKGSVSYIIKINKKK